MSDISKTADKAVSDFQRSAGSSWNSAADAAKNAAQTVRQSASSARDIAIDAARDGMGRIASASDDVAGTMTSNIREYPTTAALVFLGIGFLAGCLVARR